MPRPPELSPTEACVQLCFEAAIGLGLNWAPLHSAMQGLHDAALPSAIGKSSFVDLTDDVSDTDLEVSLQSGTAAVITAASPLQTMLLSLLCSAFDPGYVMQMQQAMEASLLETFCPDTEDTVSPETHAQQQELLLFYASQQAARMSPKTENQNPADTASKSPSAHLQQHKLQPADWHSVSEIMSETGHKGEAGMLQKEASSEQDASLKLRLSQECSDESTSSAGVNLPAQQLPGDEHCCLGQSH